jgi:acid stress chaperone HdeB
MSKRMLAACALVLALVAVPVAQAQVTIDFSKITCDQLLGYKIINPDEIAMWLSGYYNAQRGSTIVDTETLAAQKRELQDHCLRNPRVPIMQAIDKLFHAPAPKR